MFESFPKLGRLSKGITITEKIDGTNGQLHVVHVDDVPKDHEKFILGLINDHCLLAGSRNRYLTFEEDNFGFAAWAASHSWDLIEYLGPGRHYGEWWGAGIQRGYGLTEKRFSLFNTKRWGRPGQALPDYLHVVPILHTGLFDIGEIDRVMCELKETGSIAAPGFMNPEGIAIFDHAKGIMYKRTYEYDKGKWTGEK